MAKGLAEVGADLVLVGRGEEALQAAKAALAETGRSVETLSADVGEPTASEAAARRVVEQWGPVDILINNVGGRRIDVPTEKLELAGWQRIMDLNLTSAFLWSKEVGGAMLDRGWGRVINVASISGMIANRGIMGRTYETSKAAMIQFTRALAADWAPRGVTVNAIAPGALTRLTGDLEMSDEVRRNFDPAWVAPVITWLASTDSADVTGQVIEANGMVLAIAEGWHRGPTTKPVESPEEVGPLVRKLVADARPRTFFQEVN